MKKYIKWIIYLIIMLIAVITGFIIIINCRSKNEEKNYKNNTYNEISKADTVEFNSVKDTRSYFIVKNIIDRYINNIKDLNGDNYINEENLRISKDEVIKSKQDTAKKFFKSTLDENYKSEFNVSDDVIVSEAKKYMQQGDYSNSDVIYNLNFDEIDEYQYENNIILYIVSAKIKEKDLKLLIKFDSENNVFSIFLSDYIEKYNYSRKMNKSDIKIDKNLLDANLYNKIIIGTITDEDMSKEYFNIQKNNLLYDIEKIYNKLDTEYKEKKYSDYLDFEKYFLDLRNQLRESTLAKYSVANINNKSIYTLIDNDNRYYIIENENGLINYNVKLDNYTVDTQYFKEKYENSKAQEKVALNINKVITALNDKDYKYIYNKLADSFKDNYFNNEDELKEYLSNKLYDNNEINFGKFSDEGNGIYTYQIELSEISNENEAAQEGKGDNFARIKMNIVMQLKEGTDFVMSFSIE